MEKKFRKTGELVGGETTQTTGMDGKVVGGKRKNGAVTTEEWKGGRTRNGPLGKTMHRKCGILFPATPCGRP